MCMVIFENGEKHQTHSFNREQLFLKDVLKILEPRDLGCSGNLSGKKPFKTNFWEDVNHGKCRAEQQMLIAV